MMWFSEGKRMTLGLLKNVVKGLMLGDNNPPSDNGIFIGLLAYAFNIIGNKTESFHLLTLNRKQEILRIAGGDYFMRVPELPTVDTDELDIDNELGFVAARLICSMISKDKVQLHLQMVDELIRDYNGKVYQILEQIQYNPATKLAEYSAGRDFDGLSQIQDPIGLIK
jgi:hypothetical protein